MSKSKVASKTPAARGKPPVSQKNNSLPLLMVIGVILLAAVVAAIWMQSRSPAAAEPAAVAGLPAEVTVQQAREMFQNGAFLLDVRTPEEWNEAHVEGATLIPLDQLSSRANEVPPDQDVVIICRSGNRSAQARDLLKGSGFTDVTSVAGGMNDWRAAGFPTVSGP